MEPNYTSREAAALLGLSTPSLAPVVVDRARIGRSTVTPANVATAAIVGPSSAPGQPAVGLDRWTGPLEAPLGWEMEGPTPGPRVTWGPMFTRSFVPGMGSRKQNHWAVGGCLDKLDRVAGGRAQIYQRKHRHRGALDAVAFFLGIRWDTFNAGHCNQEAMRAAFFPEPMQDVRRPVLKDRRHMSACFPLRTCFGHPGEVVGEYAGAGLREKKTVKFTKQDIKLLLMLVVESLVDPKKDNGGYSYVGFRNLASRQKDPKNYNPAFDPEEPYPAEVIERVVKNWGVKDHLGIIADKKPGKKLDNRLFDAGSVRQIAERPEDLDADRVPTGGNVKYYEIDFECRGQPKDSVHLKAWVHTAPDGTQKSGWIHPKENVIKEVFDDFGETIGVVKKKNQNPDFFWIAHLQDAVKAGLPWIGFADATNPEVDNFQVWSIYMESQGQDWRSIARANPERVLEHLRVAASRGRDCSALAHELGLPWPPPPANTQR